jgi:hypothetical protein
VRFLSGNAVRNTQDERTFDESTLSVFVYCQAVRPGEKRHVTWVREPWLSEAISGRTWWFTGKADKM